MPREVLRYAPGNITPEQFMRPPTEVFQPALINLCLGVENGINEAVYRLYDPYRRSRQIFPKGIGQPALRVGSELELLLFSEDSNPPIDKEKEDDENPNYNFLHTANVTNFVYDLISPKKDGGLGEVLENQAIVSRIFAEVRTKHSGVKRYCETMQDVQEWVQKRAERSGISPVVYSQHFHFSVTSESGRNNVLEHEGTRDRVSTGLINAYHRSLPFVRLPESIESDDHTLIVSGHNGVLEKGESGKRTNPLRVEGRLNNNSYAFDPYLNLLVNLIGVYRGIAVATKSDIDQDFPLTFGRSFTIGKGHTEWDGALQHILDDKVLPEFIPSPLLQQLHTVLGSYWRISRGEMSLPEARSLAVGIRSI